MVSSASAAKQTECTGCGLRVALPDKGSLGLCPSCNSPFMKLKQLEAQKANAEAEAVFAERRRAGRGATTLPPELTKPPSGRSLDSHVSGTVRRGSSLVSHQCLPPPPGAGVASSLADARWSNSPVAGVPSEEGPAGRPSGGKPRGVGGCRAGVRTVRALQTIHPLRRCRRRPPQELLRWLAADGSCLLRRRSHARDINLSGNWGAIGGLAVPTSQLQAQTVYFCFDLGVPFVKYLREVRSKGAHLRNREREWRLPVLPSGARAEECFGDHLARSTLPPSYSAPPAQHPQAQDRTARMFPGGHWRWIYTKYLASRNKAFGGSELIRKHTVHNKPGAVASSERCVNFRRGHETHIVAMPNGAMIATIAEHVDWVLERNPEKVNDVVTREAVQAFVDHDHGDEGLKILWRHFITSVLNARLCHAATRLNIPAMFWAGVRSAADDAFAGGMTKYSVEIVRTLADQHR